MSFGPEYHKIQTVFRRDEKKLIIPGSWTMPEFEYLADKPWRWTEKVDGTNIRVHWDGERVTVGGRTDNAQIPTFILSVIQPLVTPEKFREVFPDCNDVTLYGEGYGPKIQSGGQYRKDNALILFDVRCGEWMLEPHNVEDVAGKFGLEVVPEVLKSVDSLILAIQIVSLGAMQSKWAGAKIEGIVGTPRVPMYSRNGSRIITKLKLRDFDHLRKL